MSQYPRRILADTWVAWTRPNFPGSTPTLVFVRRGTVADIPPGSALEGLYGGPGNLSAVIPAQHGQDDMLSHAAVSN
jgi:hypothetical protein